jgi:hypothetical protein
MKYRLLIFFLLLAVCAKGQNCNLLTQTFAVADTIKRENEELYRFRFSTSQLRDLLELSGMEKPVLAIGKLQKTLDEDFDSYQKNVLWQLDGKLAERQLSELKKECPETSFLVFEREIHFYRSKFKTREAADKK